MRILIVSVVAATGCATPAAALADEPPEVAAEREALRRALSDVDALRAEVKALKERLGHVEARVGLADVRNEKLRQPATPSAIRPGEGALITSHGAKARRQSLGAWVKPYAGYVVAFWATWCKPCTSDEELGHLRELQRRLRREGVELVSVAIDDLSKVTGDSRAAKWLYPLWHRQDGHLEMLPRSFIESVGLNLPLFLVVGRGGEIRYFYNDKLDVGAVRDLVTASTSACRVAQP